jgi:RHS repeat-associated protein
VLRDRSTPGNGTFNERVYVQRDANHDVTAITNASGSVLQRWTYDPYGVANCLTSNWAGTTDAYNFIYLFQGGRYDATSGLYSYQRREYDPALGRWIEQDPMGTVNGANLRQFVEGNPVTETDPSGLLVDLVFNLETGEIKATDRDKPGITVTVKAGCAFSGGHDRIGRDHKPIPVGQYEILERKNKEGWYRLDPVDSVPRNDKVDTPGEDKGRDNFRLHPGSISEGCITVRKENDECMKQYAKLRDLIDHTKSESVTDAADKKKNSITKYGNLDVIRGEPTDNSLYETILRNGTGSGIQPDGGVQPQMSPHSPSPPIIDPPQITHEPDYPHR